jgi:predicted nucleic acid-binding Zn ribbon protein
MPTYTVVCRNCGEFEIEKPMHAPLPKCLCGRTLRRVWAVMPAVQFHAAGFYATDFTRFEKMVGKEKAEHVRRQNDDAAQRAREGRLTAYEKALEGI